MKENNLYPVHYNGKKYFEKDCDEMFLCFYHTIHALNGEGGVYMSEDVWIYPDGSMSEY
tara:strand:+ start:109 stop:285 length:177 start_codon:yes stop_codon:yes gene_type:complete